MSRQKIDITGAPGVGVDSKALEYQEQRLLGFTKETSDFIKKIQTILSNPRVLFVMITFIFIMTVETLWGSYFKTQDSRDFAKGSSKFVRSMTYFSWISGTIIAFGTAMYLAGPFLFGDDFGPEDQKIILYVTGSLIFAYFINALVTGFGGAPSYTILGNFLAIK